MQDITLVNVLTCDATTQGALLALLRDNIDGVISTLARFESIAGTVVHQREYDVPAARV